MVHVILHWPHLYTSFGQSLLFCVRFSSLAIGKMADCDSAEVPAVQRSVQRVSNRSKRGIPPTRNAATSMEAATKGI